MLCLPGHRLQLCSDLFLQDLLFRLQPKSQSAALNMPKCCQALNSPSHLLLLDAFSLFELIICLQWEKHLAAPVTVLDEVLSELKDHFQPQGITETARLHLSASLAVPQAPNNKEEKENFTADAVVRHWSACSAHCCPEHRFKRSPSLCTLTLSLSADNTAPCRNEIQLQVTAEILSTTFIRRCET